MRFLLLFCLSIHTAFGQELLTPDEAVRIALENNYGIRLARADAEIGKINNTKGYAGMLPTVNLVANEQFSVNAFHQKLASGSEFNTAAAPFNTANAAIQLNWPLYDGRLMFVTKSRLEAIQKLGELNTQAAVFQLTNEALAAYYNIVKNKLQRKSIEEIIALNTERLRIAEARLAAGMAAQTDALQARIDLNQRKSDLMLMENAIETAKRALNLLLARPADTAFDVTDQLESTFQPDKAALIGQMNAQNPQLLALRQNEAVAALVVEEARRLNKLRINGIGQFNVAKTDNGGGQVKSSAQAGIAVGASLALPLYAGGNYKRQVEVAKVNALKANLNIEQTRMALENNLENALAQFETYRKTLLLDSQNIDAARESLQVSTERFRLGQTNALEVQAAQNNLEQALQRLNLTQFNVKIAELAVKAVVGIL